jgi:hypothetical protein
MERAERLIALGLGLLFPALLVPILWIMLGLTMITAGAALRQGVAAGLGRGARVGPIRERSRARVGADRRVARSTARQVRRRTQLRPPR